MKNKMIYLSVNKDFGNSQVVSMDAMKGAPRGSAKFNPYVVAFCYPFRGTAFIVKGDRSRVDGYIAGLNRPIYVCFSIHYSAKLVTPHYQFFGMDKRYSLIVNAQASINIPNSNALKMRRKFEVVDHEIPEVIFTKQFRRMPRCWPKEADPYVPKMHLRTKSAIRNAMQVFGATQSILENTMA